VSAIEMYSTLGMPNPYDEALRRRVIDAYEAGEGTYDDLAAVFAVGARTIHRWVIQFRTDGTVAALPKGGGWQSPILLPMLHALIAEAPDATCAELCWAYNRRAPAAHQTTPSSLWRAVRRAGYVLKKNGRGHVRSTALTSSGNARRTAAGGAASTGGASFLSMTPGRTSRWAARTRGSRRARNPSNRAR
jgi:transposase